MHSQVKTIYVSKYIRSTVHTARIHPAFVCVHLSLDHGGLVCIKRFKSLHPKVVIMNNCIRLESSNGSVDVD